MELRIVWDVLILAASAAPKVRARRGDALRRGFRRRFRGIARASGFSLRETVSTPARTLPAGLARHEYRIAFMMRQSIAAIHELFNSNFHFGIAFRRGNVILELVEKGSRYVIGRGISSLFGEERFACVFE